MSVPVPIKFLDSSKYTPHVKSMEEYLKIYEESIRNNSQFWNEKANELLSWFSQFNISIESERDFSNSNGSPEWFSEGTLNACYNCVDRHAEKNPNAIAIVWEGDEPGNTKEISYGELLNEICATAKMLLSYGLKKGDVVALYMPMIPESVYAILACARLGLVHNVVFAGFSAESLRERLKDSNAKLLFTANVSVRGGKKHFLKTIVDDALGHSHLPCLKHVIVAKQLDGFECKMIEGRDHFWTKSPTTESAEFIPCVAMKSEDPLFILYTSGSTGKPKGLVHTTAGYLLYATITTKYIFDLHPGDRFGCTADVGWITGHSYLIYGPLSNGVSTLVFEGVPTYPRPTRLWELITHCKLTQLYTAPTLIRSLKKVYEQNQESMDAIIDRLDYQSNLRLLGSVGEPINPEAWKWYFDKIGKSKCPIVDTYWQTESGGILICTLPGVGYMIPGSTGLPFFGIKPKVHQQTLSEDSTSALLIEMPWPGIARTVLNAHSKYLACYFEQYPGSYFTGDGALINSAAGGIVTIKGRLDAGHRLSTAEIESALCKYPGCVESAVLGVEDEITGQSICAFCVFINRKDGDDTRIKTALVATVREAIGPIAAPKRIILCSDLPKTRSGKIMRRLLRKMLAKEDNLGDLSTLHNPE